MSLLVFGFTGCGLFPTAGVWTRIDSQTIAFTGRIQAGVDREFFRIITPETKKIIVKSGGGDILTALAIGTYIFEHQLSIEVDELCGSSCANYWFTAASTKIVRQGALVGFHGDYGSSVPYWKNPSPQELEQAKVIIAAEKVFYQKIGLDERIFVFSIEFELANNAEFWIASPEELACVGVKNLEMWFSPNLADYTLANSISPPAKTSFQDVRVPRPSLCHP
jgi:hypothetical protein